MTNAPQSAAALPVHERTAEFFERVRRRKREIVTPEGVPLRVDIADYGERLVAFVIDFIIWMLLTAAVYVPVLALIGRTRGFLIAIAIALFIGFLIRNFYFIYFELMWEGTTPGKRLLGLRVIDRNGGPLLASAVIARNLTREVEMFIPLGLLLQGGHAVAGGGVNWANLATAGLLLFFLVLPMINRDRMRGGDLIAGTMVIELPKRVLSSDLGERALRFTFTPAQLRAYGVFELQVLEELLRRPQNEDSLRVLDEVCAKIRRKIGWTESLPGRDVVPFLRDFYTAERAFLEREQLFGKGRADKYADARPSPPSGPR